MKLVSYEVAGRPDIGLVVGAGVVALGERLGCVDLKSALPRLGEIESLSGQKPDHSIEDIQFLPPIPNPERILCIGLNYMTHLRETGREPPAKPMVFTRFASSQVGHLRPLLRPRVSEQFDFEGELAVVIGRECHYVEPGDAMSVIAGYSCYNDGSIRDWQRHSTQFSPGKNFPRSGSFGPYLVTPDEIADIRACSLVTRLNGMEMQRAVIGDLVFDIPALIAYCSSFTSLSPGDVIVTGTTGGVGAFRKPPVWMKPGDTVEVEIAGVGTLTNSIEDEV